MAKQKISNLAKELNVGLPNIFEFLRKNNIEIVESPNTRVEDTVVEMLTHHFQPDRELKTRSDQQTTDRCWRSVVYWSERVFNYRSGWK